MRYRGTVIRPPSEADSLILQVTYGCSQGGCDFCGTYLDKPFRVRPFAEVVEDVTRLPAHFKAAVRRVFLADGDAVVLPQRRLQEILELLHGELPCLERVSAYATARALLRKEVGQLAALRERGLTLLYLGLESGDDATLAACHKGVTVAEQVEACDRAHAAGMALSLTTILGLAGEARSLEHARATGAALSRIDPAFIGVLSLMVVEGTPLAERVQRREFVVPGPWVMLRELRELLAATEVSGALFRSNHASNYLPVGGRLPEDKERMLAALDAALAAPEMVSLRPESWRAL
ncbi:MAG: radical SAM protein [Thermoleophilia bacterium]